MQKGNFHQNMKDSTLLRVYCLYRVSTKGQVDHNDIPLQKQECHEFAKRMGWTICKEFYEKGISGYKISANNRDAIQDLKIAAEKKEFDILLVFMFDRLGRIENETPFVLEWFVKNGIAVWSAKEGQQTFENDTDYLMNYIRFWQAGGESRKTSIRVKTRLGQLVEEGKFTGGVCPFGNPDSAKVYLDISMKRFETVFPAAGSGNSAVEMTCGELEQASEALEWIDVCK